MVATLQKVGKRSQEETKVNAGLQLFT